MPRLTQAPPQGAAEPALLPARHGGIHEGALLAIIHGDRFADLPWSADDKARMEAEAESLRACGVGPERARVLLARLKRGPSLTVIDGGGERTADSRRPALALVRAL